MPLTIVCFVSASTCTRSVGSSFVNFASAFEKPALIALVAGATRET